eukprot:c24959_g1_i1 orf=112-465(-)
METTVSQYRKILAEGVEPADSITGNLDKLHRCGKGLALQAVFIAASLKRIQHAEREKGRGSGKAAPGDYWAIGAQRRRRHHSFLAPPFFSSVDEPSSVTSLIRSSSDGSSAQLFHAL